MSDVSETYIKEITDSYNIILALGNDVKHILTKMGIEHYSLPHPSPLNRKFNDKKFEISVINGLQSYLNMV